MEAEPQQAAESEPEKAAPAPAPAAAGGWGDLLLRQNAAAAAKAAEAIEAEVQKEKGAVAGFGSRGEGRLLVLCSAGGWLPLNTFVDVAHVAVVIAPGRRPERGGAGAVFRVRRPSSGTPRRHR